MKRGIVFFLLLTSAVAVSACSALPGLRVITGQDTEETTQDQTVEALDLVMADKTGMTDPTLVAAADRIEAASGNVDVIEIRPDLDNRVFQVNMLYRPPQTENTLQGQVERNESLRRAIELTWQGTMLDSEGTDLIHITLMQPQSITTLDNGVSFIGIVVADAEIERGAAASYLAGDRSLGNFFDLIALGTLTYQQPNTLELYEGQPNHPMFMLAGLQ